MLAHGYCVVNWYKGGSQLVITGDCTNLVAIEQRDYKKHA